MERLGSAQEHVPAEAPDEVCRRHEADALAILAAAARLVARWWVRRPSGRWLAVRPAHQTRGWQCTSPPEQVRAAVHSFLSRQGVGS